MATPSGDVLNRKIADGGEIAKQCGDVEEAIAALRMSYEQYFLGMERRPPTTEHNELKKQMQRLKGAFVRQTALKFRIQALQAKLTTYERLWTRTLQEIENGTYRRDLFKAKLHAQERVKSKGDGDQDKDDDEDTLPPGVPPAKGAAAPAPQPSAPAPAAAAAGKAAPPSSKPAAQPAARPAAPAAAAAGNSGLSAALSDQKLKAVFDAYVTAKKRCQEDVSKLSYEQVAANLRKQVPELVKKAGAQGVEFKVIIKDGKAILRAVPK